MNREKEKERERERASKKEKGGRKEVDENVLTDRKKKGRTLMGENKRCPCVTKTHRIRVKIRATCEERNDLSFYSFLDSLHDLIHLKDPSQVTLCRSKWPQVTKVRVVGGIGQN